MDSDLDLEDWKIFADDTRAMEFQRLLAWRDETPDELVGEFYIATCLRCGDPIEHQLTAEQHARPCEHGHPVAPTISLAEIRDGAKGNDFQEMQCQRCHSPMLLRRGDKGRFWGCQRYPKCTGTRWASPEAAKQNRSVKAIIPDGFKRTPFRRRR